MQTIQVVYYHKFEHKCRQYSHYVIKSVNTNDDNAVNT